MFNQSICDGDKFPISQYVILSNV